MTPIVSVIMSTYNREKYLIEAVNSVLAQSFSDFEFIIIDDNSTDDTFKILKNFKDKRIRIFKNSSNCGCTFNYHQAQNLAEGKFIAHIDDDDIWFENKLAKQIEYMNNHEEIVLNGCFIETFGENNSPSWVVDINPDKIAFLMNFYNPLCHSSIIYRKSFMLQNGINYDINKKYSQDYDFYSQIIKKDGKISNLPDILVKYRMHKNRITDINETQNIQIYNAENIKKELLQRFLNEDEIREVKNLVKNFPFNDYNADNVLKAIEIVWKKYKPIFKPDEKIIEEIKNHQI